MDFSFCCQSMFFICQKKVKARSSFVKSVFPVIYSGSEIRTHLKYL